MKHNIVNRVLCIILVSVMVIANIRASVLATDSSQVLNVGGGVDAADPVDFPVCVENISAFKIKDCWYMGADQEKTVLEPEIVSDAGSILKTYDLTDLNEDGTVSFSIGFACRASEDAPVHEGDYFKITLPKEFSKIQLKDVQSEVYDGVLSEKADGSTELLVTMLQDVVGETDGELELHFNIAAFAEESDSGTASFILKEEAEQKDVVTYLFRRDPQIIVPETVEEPAEEAAGEAAEETAEKTVGEPAEEAAEEPLQEEAEELTEEPAEESAGESDADNSDPEQNTDNTADGGSLVTGDFSLNGHIVFNEVIDGVDWKDLVRPEVFEDPIKIIQYYDDGTVDAEGYPVLKHIEYEVQDSVSDQPLFLSFTHDGEGAGDFVISYIPKTVTVEDENGIDHVYQVADYEVFVEPRLPYYVSSTIEIDYNNGNYSANTDTITLSLKTQTLTLQPTVKPDGVDDDPEFTMEVTFTNNAVGEISISDDDKTEKKTFSPKESSPISINVPVGLDYSVVETPTYGYTFDGDYTTTINEDTAHSTTSETASGTIENGENIKITTVNYVKNLTHEFDVQWIDNNRTTRPSLITKGTGRTEFFDLQFRRNGTEDEWVTVSEDTLAALDLSNMPEIEEVSSNGFFTTYSFKGLPALNAAGDEIEFQVVLNEENFYNEDSVTSDYTAELAGVDDNGKKTFKLTEKTNFTASIKWNDAGNEKLGSDDESTPRPEDDVNDPTDLQEKLGLKLYRRVGTGAYEEVATKDSLDNYITISEGSNIWEVNIKDLPRYDANNHEYDYVLVQGTFDAEGNLTPAAVTPHISEVDGSAVSYKTYYNNGSGNYGNDYRVCHNGGTITEKLVTSKEFTAHKVWKDENDSASIASRPTATVTLWRFVRDEVAAQMPEGADMLDYAYQNGLASQVVYQVTDEQGEVDERIIAYELGGGTTENIEFNKGKIVDLPSGFKFPGNDNNGNKYVYFVREILTGENADNYLITYTDGAATHKEGAYTGGTITNTRREKASANVTKIWEAAGELATIADNNTEVQLELWAKIEGGEYEKLQVYSSEQGSYDILTDTGESEDHSLQDAQTVSGFTKTIAMGETSYYVNIYNSEGIPYDMSTARIVEIIRGTNAGGTNIDTVTAETDDAEFELYGKTYTKKSTVFNMATETQEYTLLGDGTKQYRYSQTNTISEKIYFKYHKIWDPSIAYNTEVANDVQGIVMTLYRTTSNETIADRQAEEVGKYIISNGHITLIPENITDGDGTQIGSEYIILEGSTTSSTTSDGGELKTTYYWDAQTDENLNLYDEDGYLYEYTAVETGFISDNTLKAVDTWDWHQDYVDFQVIDANKDIKGEGTRIRNYKDTGTDPYFIISKKWYDFGDDRQNRGDVQVRIYYRESLKAALEETYPEAAYPEESDTDPIVDLDNLKTGGVQINSYPVDVVQSGIDVYDTIVYFKNLYDLSDGRNNNNALKDYVVLEYKLGNGDAAEYSLSALRAVAAGTSYYSLNGTVENTNRYEATNLFAPRSVGSSHDSVKITNRRIGDTTISASKEWEDESNQSGERPASVQFQLYQNAQEYKADGITVACEGQGYTANYAPETGIVTVTAAAGTASDTWKFTITGLPMYNSIGSLYSYNLEEITQSTVGRVDYQRRKVAAMGEDDSATQQTYNFKYTNTITGSIDHVAYKVWKDEAIGPDHRPDLYFTLYRYLKKDKAAIEATGKTLEELAQSSNQAEAGLVTRVTDCKDQIWTPAADQTGGVNYDTNDFLDSSAYNWKISVSDLPRFNSEGQEYIYEFTESMNHDGETIMGKYIQTFETREASDPASGSTAVYDVFTNTLADYMRVEGKKIWTGLSGYNLNNNENKIDLPNPEIFLYRITEEDAENYHITDLQHYSDDEFLALLKDINDVPEGTPEEEILEGTTGKLVYVDRTTLIGQRKTAYSLPVTNTPIEGICEKIGDVMMLPKFNEDGERYVYLVREFMEDLIDDVFAAEINDNGTINNAFRDDTNRRCITVTKTWEDRPENSEYPSVNFKLYRYEIGDEADTTKLIAEHRISAKEFKDAEGKDPSENVSYTFDDLLIYSQTGAQFCYYVVEDPDIKGYTNTTGRIDVTDLPNDWNQTINNEHPAPDAHVTSNNKYDMQGNITIQGTKIWNDYQNSYDLRNPDSKTMGEVVTIRLYRYTLPEPGQNNAIADDVTSESVNLTVIGENDSVPETGACIKWTCEGDYNTADNWHYEIYNLERYAPNGQPYHYIIDEDQMPNYTKTKRIIIPTDNEDYYVNNEDRLNAGELENKFTAKCYVRKNWYDGNNKYELRPADITVYLQRRAKESSDEWENIELDLQDPDPYGANENALPTVDGQYVSVKLTSANEIKNTNHNSWEFTFENLPDIYEYRCVETEIGGIEVAQQDGTTIYSAGSYRCYDAHNPDINKSVISNVLDATTLDVTKIWEGDQDDFYHTRPESVDFILQKRRAALLNDTTNEWGAWENWENVTLGENSTAYTFSISKEDGWTKTLVDLPVADVQVVTDGDTRKLQIYKLQFRAVEVHADSLYAENITDGSQNYCDVTNYGADSTEHIYNDSTLRNESVITNELRTDHESITVTKQWNRTDGDAVNATFELLYAIKPAEDADLLQLYSDNSSMGWSSFIDPITETRTVSGDSLEDVITWSDLPKYDADGNELIYKVIEYPVDGYKTEVEAAGSDQSAYTYKFTNTELQSYTVEKQWLKTEDALKDADGNYTATFKLQQYVVPKMVSADQYLYPEGESYTYVGKRVVDDDNSNITVYYTSEAAAANGGRNIMNDFARFLGALHESGIYAIEFNGKTYTWYESLGNTGSNWGVEEKKTLVSKIVNNVLSSGSVDGSSISLDWDGKTYQYIAHIVSDENYNSIVPSASTSASAAVSKAVAADRYEYTENPYTYVGKRVVNEENSTIDVYYTSSSISETKIVNIKNDLARYLGALYHCGVTDIAYEGQNYYWDEEGTLKGSNWAIIETVSLVSHVVTYLEENPNTTDITLKWDGQDHVYSCDVGNEAYSEIMPTAGQDVSVFTDVEGAEEITISSAESLNSKMWKDLPKYTEAGEKIIYRAVETKINGIDVNGDTNGQYVVTYVFDEDQTSPAFDGTKTTAENRMVYGFVNLSKAAAYLAPEITAGSGNLAGVNFNIYKGDELYIEGITTDAAGTLVCNADGTYGTPGRYLVAGTYTIREASTNADYSVWDKGISFTVGTNGGTTDTGEHGTAWITTKKTWLDYLTNGIHLEVEYLPASGSHSYQDSCAPQTGTGTGGESGGGEGGDVTPTPEPAYNIESRGVITFTKTGPNGAALDVHANAEGESKAYFGVYLEQACTTQVAGMSAADGVNFVLTNKGQDGAILGAVTDSAGVPYLRAYGIGFSLLSGDYYVKELVAPPGYKLDTTVRKATIGRITTAVDENLDNVYANNGAVIDSLTDLEWANTENEVQIFKMDQYGRKVTLNEGEYLELKAGTGTFKTGENTIRLYQDASKPAAKTDGTTAVTGITFADGVWTITGLFDIGKTYTLSEPAAAVPSDHLKAEDISFTMGADGALTIVTGATESDDPTAATGGNDADFVSHYKASTDSSVLVMRDKARYLIDVDIDKKETGTEITIPNISFKLYKYDSVDNGNYTELKNVLGTKNADGTIAADDSLFLTTDDDGEIMISEQADTIYNTVTGCLLKYGLDVGKYYVEEIEQGASDSYRLVGKVFFEIIPDDDAQNDGKAFVVFETSEGSVTQETGSNTGVVYNVPVTDTDYKKTLNLTKTDADSSGTKLSGARFTLDYTSITYGQAGSADTESFNCVTDDNGELYLANVNGDTWTITSEKPDISRKGTYVLTEIKAPDAVGSQSSYITPEKEGTRLNTVTFAVDSDNKITINSTNANFVVSSSVISSNEEHTGISVAEKNHKTVLSIAKRNDLEGSTKTKNQKSLNGEKLAGATLQIFEGTAAAGTPVEEWNSTDADHVVNAGILKENTIYTLHESVPPTGYLQADDIYFYIFGTMQDDASASQVYVWTGTGTPSGVSGEGWSKTTNIKDTVLTMVDEAVIAPIDVQKVVGDSTYALLPGAVFDVKEGSTVLGTAESAAAGYLVWKTITAEGYASGQIYDASGRKVTSADNTDLIGTSIILQKNAGGYTFTETYAPDHAYNAGGSYTVRITDYDYKAYKTTTGYNTNKYVNILRTSDSTAATASPLAERTTTDQAATASDLVNPVFKTTFQLYKYDAEHGSINEAENNYAEIGMSGVTFTLSRKNDEGTYDTVGDYTTGDNGLLSVDISKKGDYKLAEKSAPAGYKLSSEVLTFTIVNEDYNKILTYDDTQTSTNHTKEVTDGEANSGDGEPTGDSSGTAGNTYGYPNSRQHGSVTLTKQDANNASIKLSGVKYRLTRTTPAVNTLVDKYFPSVQAAYLDVETGKTYGNIAGAAAENEITVAAGETGVLTLNDLQWGTYTLVEIQENEGYVLDDSEEKKITFTVGAANAETTQTLTDSGKEAVLNTKNQLTIKKAAMDGATLLNGAKFKLFKVTDGKIDMTAAAAFYAAAGDETQATNTEFTVTGGSLTIYGISKGTYVVRETLAPDGYELAGDLLFTMGRDGVVSAVSACRVAADTGAVTALDAEASSEVVILNDDNKTLTIKDQPIEVSLKKVDADTEGGLADAVYEITPANGGRFAVTALSAIAESDKKTENGTTTVTVTSDAATGIIAIPSALLVAGQSYVIHEATAPDSYELGADVTISVGTDGTITVTNNGSGIGEAVLLTAAGDVDPANGTVIGLRLKDEPIEVYINKTFEGASEMTNKPDGAVFKITPASGSAFAGTTVGQGAASSGYVAGDITDISAMENTAYVKVTAAAEGDSVGTGTIMIPKGLLKQGNSYVLEEVQTSDGYQLDNAANSITFTVGEDGKAAFTERTDTSNTTFTGTATDTVSVTNKRTELSIKKTADDATTEYDLASMAFTLTQVGSDGNAIAGGFTETWVPGLNGSNKKESNTKVYRGLTAGWYMLTESICPTGYKQAEPIYFKLDQDNKVTGAELTDGTLAAVSSTENDPVSQVGTTNCYLVTMENTLIRGHAELSKVFDNDESKPVQDAVFTLYKAVGDAADTDDVVIAAGLRTDASGKWTTAGNETAIESAARELLNATKLKDGLTEGYYYLMETGCDGAYLTDEAKQKKYTFTIGENYSSTITVDGDSAAAGTQAISNIPYTSTFTLWKTEDADHAFGNVSGATFAVYYSGTFDNDVYTKIGEGTTGPDGKFTCQVSKKGSYLLKETSNKGYKISEWYYKFELDDSCHDTTWNLKETSSSEKTQGTLTLRESTGAAVSETANAKIETLTVAETDFAEAEGIENTRRKVTVRIIKKDKDNVTLLGGVYFAVYKKADTVGGQPNAEAQPVVSGMTGTNGEVDLTGLDWQENDTTHYGEYVLVETKTIGGYHTRTSIEITLRRTLFTNDTDTPVYTVTDTDAANEKMKLVIHKTSDDATPVNLSGAVFAVYEAADVTVNTDGTHSIAEKEDSQDEKDPVRSGLTTEADGTVTMEGSLVGGKDYALVEVIPPGGYKVSQPVYFHVSEDGAITAAVSPYLNDSTSSTITTATFEADGDYKTDNKIEVSDKQIDITLNKQNLTGDALSGAVFEVSGTFVNMGDETVVTEQSASDPGENNADGSDGDDSGTGTGVITGYIPGVTTDNASAMLKGRLIAGQEYLFTETTAPKGYELMTASVIVDEYGRLTVLEVSNGNALAANPDGTGPEGGEISTVHTGNASLALKDTPIEITIIKNDWEAAPIAEKPATYTLSPVGHPEGSASESCEFAMTVTELAAMLGTDSGITITPPTGDNAKIDSLTLVTSADEGTISVPSALLIAGHQYELTETQAPEGYELASYALTFTVNADGTLTLNYPEGLTDEKLAQYQKEYALYGDSGIDATKIKAQDRPIEIKLNKEDLTNNKQSLSGAVFHVTGDFAGNANDANGIDVTVSDSGVIAGLTGKLVTGEEYTFTETTPPEGYELYGTDHLSTGLTFTILVKDDKTDGSGTYFEVTAINGAVVGVNPVVKPDDSASPDQEMIRVANTPVEITLKKLGEDGDTTKALEGAVFTLTPKPADNNGSGDGDGEGDAAAQGSDFADLYKDGKTGPAGNYSADNNTITLTTAADGTIAIPSAALVIGNTYVLTETEAPAGYELAGEITFTVKADGSIERIARTENTDGTGTVQAVTLGEDTVGIEVTDTLIDAKISKFGLVNGGAANTQASGSDAPLAGATFELEPESGSSFAKSPTNPIAVNNVVTLTSAADGTINIEKGILKQKNTYVLKEIGTVSGYYLGNAAKEGIRIYIDAYGQLTLAGKAADANKEQAPYTIDNDAGIKVTNPQTTSFTITKEITGNMGDLEGTFHLTVKVTEPDGSVILNKDNEQTTTVVLRRTKTYNDKYESSTDYTQGIPVGATVEIVEPEDSGYTAKVEGQGVIFGAGLATVTENVGGDRAKVQIVLNPNGVPETVNIKLINYKDVNIDVGVPSGTDAPFMMLVLLIPTAWLAYRYRRKRKGGEC